MPAPALLNDLYQITMANAYLDGGLAGRRAVFELFFRKAPMGGTYALAAGIGPALDFLEGFRFEGREIDYLRSLGIFSPELLARLEGIRFTGDVDAVLEGTAVFPQEPILRVSAPIIEAQLLETPLLNLTGFATLVATKAARICAAAGPAEAIEFGCRRAPGPDGSIIATRSAFIGGAAATSNLEAGRLLGIPVRGTMAHSYVLAFPSEIEAFRAFVKTFPGMGVLLIDTVSTLGSGLPNAIAVARELQAAGRRLAGVRIDSGDLASIARGVREGFDEAGFRDVKIYASGDLDERSIEAMVEARAPIDAFGVGTRLVRPSSDAGLSSVYKLVAIEEGSGPGLLKPRMKHTDDHAKATLPGAKQVYREIGQPGEARGDWIALDSTEDRPEGWPREGGGRNPAADAQGSGPSRFEPLLLPAFRRGKRVRPPESLSEIQARARSSLKEIPESHRRLKDPVTYPVSLSPALQRLCLELKLK